MLPHAGNVNCVGPGNLRQRLENELRSERAVRIRLVAAGEPLLQILQARNPRIDAGGLDLAALHEIVRQLGQNALGVTDNRDVHGADLAHLCRVDVSVDYLCVGGERVSVARDAVVETRADGD